MSEFKKRFQESLQFTLIKMYEALDQAVDLEKELCPYITILHMELDPFKVVQDGFLWTTKARHLSVSKPNLYFFFLCNVI